METNAVPVLFDFSKEELETYLPERSEPEDFDSFWANTLAEARAKRERSSFRHLECDLRTVEVFDSTFAGYAGHPIKAWLLVPRHRDGPLPCVVEFLGYGDGRSFPADRLLYSAAGFAHFVMDNRGQGSGYRPGDTPDLGIDTSPHYPGFMTSGIQSPTRYFYRRIITDAVLAMDAAAQHEAVDGSRIAAVGVSQGGGLALAVAGLYNRPAAVVCDVPFLCHYRRATEISETPPYNEIARYCSVHRDQVDRVFATLAYFDGVNFAARAMCPALFSVGLMDNVCPPSTVYAAFNHYAGPKQIRVWPYNAHDGGGPHQDAERIHFLRQVLAISPPS